MDDRGPQTVDPLPRGLVERNQRRNGAGCDGTQIVRSVSWLILIHSSVSE
jgi:hypothetical protein